MEIQGSVVVVTGASSGIGAATARLAHERGARVVAVARRAELLDALVAELPGALALPVDVADDTAATEVVTRAVEAFGRVDVLVNNAGAGLSLPLWEVDAADFRTILELNLVAPLRLMQAAVPGMRERGAGAVVNVSSGTTLVARRSNGAYSATKAALEQLSDVARADLDGTGVVVSTLLPSLTVTDFARAVVAGDAGDLAERTDDPQFELQSAEYAAGRILDTVVSGENHVVLGWRG